jgi:autotransporter-associated beta strand protein/T5SS/PEP-CTERM-associated repeat protein
MGGLVTGGTGNLMVTNGGLVNVQHMTFAQRAGSSSTSVVDAATLTVRGALALGLLGGTGTLTVQNGGTVTVSSLAVLGEHAGATGTINVTGAGSTLTGSAAQSLIVGGGATPGGSGNLNVTAGGAVTAANINLGQNTSAVGNVVVDAGRLTANLLLAVGQAGNGTLTVQNGGTLISGGDVVIATGAGATSNLTVTGANSTMTVTNQIHVGGSGGSAGGTGILRVLAGGSLVGNERLAIYPTGSVEIDAGPISVGALSNGVAASQSGGISINNTTLMLTNGLGLSYSGAISGNGSLAKSGTGTQILTGASAYIGTTNITAGTLQMDGTLNAQNAAVTASGTGTLAGSGTINRPVNTQSGGTIKPGSSPGTLTVGGAVTMSAGSAYGFQYAGTPAPAPVDSGISLAAGTGNNLLVVLNSLAIDNGAIFKIQGNFADFIPGQTYSFQVASGNPVTTFNITNPAQFDTTAFAGFVGASLLQFHNVGNQVLFNFTPVPEPLHILLVSGGAAAGISWWRRRTNRRVQSRIIDV